MESALHVIKLTKYTDFDVQTSLFSYRMATRIFAFGDDIPTEIVEKVKELDNSSNAIGAVIVTADRVWDDFNSVYSETEFTGVEVETYAFQDANYIHAAVGKIVEDFLNAHKRVIAYVPK